MMERGRADARVLQRASGLPVDFPLKLKRWDGWEGTVLGIRLGCWSSWMKELSFEGFYQTACSMDLGI